jgi:ketosteroid isomerase-like protein
MLPNPGAFAHEWIAAWNSHDLDRILAHYHADCELVTPMAAAVLGPGHTSLRGQVALRGYWAAALERVPDLHFELLDVAQGADGIAVYYKSVLDKRAIEAMRFDEQGKVIRVTVFYT